jgi:hypothetical protein
VAGDTTTATRIEPLQLVAFKGCAFGVVAIELLSDAPLHAFHGRGAGRIEVQFARVPLSRARLGAGNNGRGQPAGTEIAYEMPVFAACLLQYGPCSGQAEMVNGNPPNVGGNLMMSSGEALPSVMDVEGSSRVTGGAGTLRDARQAPFAFFPRCAELNEVDP